eukprot:scaffold313527_cov19-Prasinocladus_malaysianus.AAC.1
MDWKHENTGEHSARVVFLLFETFDNQAALLPAAALATVTNVPLRAPNIEENGVKGSAAASTRTLLTLRHGKAREKRDIGHMIVSSF